MVRKEGVLPPLFIDTLSKSMEGLKQKILNIATVKAKEQEVSLVELTITGSGKSKILLLIDSEKGLTIDQCTSFSRSMTQELDLFPELDAGYVIEVSSPGVDRPLQFPFQYRKNVGRKLRVTLTEGEEHEGELLEATEEGFTVKLPGLKKKEFVNQEYQYKEVKKAKVIVSFK